MRTGTAAKKETHDARAAERASHAEHRRLAQERLGVLRTKLKDALAARRAKMKEIVIACREERRVVREQVKAMWMEGRRAIRERADSERRRVRDACLAEKKRAKEECDTAIARARAELAAETKRAASEARIARQERAEHDALERTHDPAAALASVRLAMLGAFGPLYDRVRPQAGESRPEAILRYAETHPEVAHAVLHPAAERAIVETRAQLAAAERAAGAPTRSKFGRTRRAKPAATPLERTRRKGDLSTRDGGMLLADLLRERDELAVERALRKEAKARGGLRLVSRGEGAANVGGTYGMRWTDGDGRTGWVLRSGKGSPPWTGAYDDAAERARRMTAATRTRTTFAPTPYPEAKLTLVEPDAARPSDMRAVASSVRGRSRAEVKAPELRDTAEIAKRIRADIAQAVKTTDLPKATYRVRTSKYSMGSSIDVTASKLPFPVINPDAYVVRPGANFVTFDGTRVRSRFSPEAQTVFEKLQAIVNAYNWDRSDSATDYVNVRFHGDVHVTEDSGKWKRFEAEKVAAARRTER